MKTILLLLSITGALIAAEAEKPKLVDGNPPVLTDMGGRTIWRATTRFQAAEARVATLEATKAKAELELPKAEAERDAAKAAVNNLFDTICGDPGYKVEGDPTNGEPKCVPKPDTAKPAKDTPK
jgi:hypothetical protein